MSVRLLLTDEAWAEIALSSPPYNPVPVVPQRLAIDGRH